MVGTAPTQLESRNELIRFDHEYYTTASPPQDSVAVCCKEEEVVCEVEVSSEEQTTDDCQPNTENAILPNVCDLDLSLLADPELWDHLEQIIDADQLLGQAESSPTAEISNPPTELVMNQEPSRKTGSIKTLPFQISDGFDINSPLCDSMDTFSVEPWSSQSPINDFRSSSSGIGSPFSDELLDGEDYSLQWEESFIELFPALV